MRMLTSSGDAVSPDALHRAVLARNRCGLHAWRGQAVTPEQSCTAAPYQRSNRGRSRPLCRPIHANMPDAAPITRFLRPCRTPNAPRPQSVCAQKAGGRPRAAALAGGRAGAGPAGVGGALGARRATAAGLGVGAREGAARAGRAEPWPFSCGCGDLSGVLTRRLVDLHALRVPTTESPVVKPRHLPAVPRHPGQCALPGHYVEHGHLPILWACELHVGAHTGATSALGVCGSAVVWHVNTRSAVKRVSTVLIHPTQPPKHQLTTHPPHSRRTCLSTLSACPASPTRCGASPRRSGWRAPTPTGACRPAAFFFGVLTATGAGPQPPKSRRTQNTSPVDTVHHPTHWHRAQPTTTPPPSPSHRQQPSPLPDPLASPPPHRLPGATPAAAWWRRTSR
jgi:hypothetical protein